MTGLNHRPSILGVAALTISQLSYLARALVEKQGKLDVKFLSLPGAGREDVPVTKNWVGKFADLDQTYRITV